MVFSGLPPLVREQDRYRAGFTVRNASDLALDVELQANVEPDSRRQAAGVECATAAGRIAGSRLVGERALDAAAIVGRCPL